MGWTKEKPTKPGLYAAIHLNERRSSYGEPKLVSVSESLKPPLSKRDDGVFDWDRYDAPIEEWQTVLVGWASGAEFEEPLEWWSWWFELAVDPVPQEVQDLVNKQKNQASENESTESIQDTDRI